VVLLKITGFQELLMACGVIAKEPSGPGLDTSGQIQGALDEVQFDFVEEFVNIEDFGGIGQRVVARKMAGCLK